ncbi:hypothetical protein BGZ76_009506, partial [Entomortierella beljakovae]
MTSVPPTTVGPSTTSTSIPTITVTNTATPRMALSGTKTRKVMCRGFTPKHKNIEANTLTLLRAMQSRPPFVPFGRRRAAWEKVADLIRISPDLTHANGILCEGRYKQVRQEYQTAQAESRRATGIAEAPPTEHDYLVEALITLEADANRNEEEERERIARAAAEDNQMHAVALDIREQATVDLDRRSQGPIGQAPVTEELNDDNNNIIQPLKRRRRRNDNGDDDILQELEE